MWSEAAGIGDLLLRLGPGVFDVQHVGVGLSFGV